MAEFIFFILFAIGACVGSLGVLIAKNPVNSAVSLVMAFFFLAGTYILLNAEFMAIIQVLVYAGAIMVLFVFVLMLLNLRDDELGDARIGSHQMVASLFGVAILVVLIQTSTAFVGSRSQIYANTVPSGFGGVESVGDLMLTRYVLPFEMAAVLLLVGIVSAVVVAKKRL